MNQYTKNGKISKNYIAFMIRNKYTDREIYETFINYLKQEFSLCKSETEIDAASFFMDSDIDEIIPKNKRDNGQSVYYQNLKNIFESFVNRKKEEKLTDKVV